MAQPPALSSSPSWAAPGSHERDPIGHYEGGGARGGSGMARPLTRGVEISRREFLGRAGQTGLGALALASSPLRAGPALGQPVASGVREFHLEPREVTWELAPGRTIKAMAYNGQIPGPELRVREGERVRVVLRNALTEPTTVHWHGVDV